jgi:hypothetical protein
VLQAFSSSPPSDDHHAFASGRISTPFSKNSFRPNHDHRNASAKPSGFRHQLDSKQTGPINPGAKRDRDFQHKPDPKRLSPTQWTRFLEDRDRARKAADNAIRKKYFPELPEPRASPPPSRPSRAQANVAASEAASDDAKDPIFFGNQEVEEQPDDYTDDDYFAMIVAQGHFDTEVEDFSHLDDSDTK